ncbi:MAG TPA: V-type ATPase 116kDa subunit family protein [Lentimicrobium sp.]|nr:V-type ATPase 116kDa subunit family protein [Lentimicrobium sp.]
MIVPMYKYSFVVYHREYDKFLEDIAKIGVVDVSVRRDDVDDVIRTKLLVNAQLTEMIRILSNRKVPLQEPQTQKNGAEVLNEVRNIQTAIEKLTHKASLLKKEILLAEPWGDYSTEIISNLHKEGYTLRFFITPERRFTPQLHVNPGIIEINRLQSNVYFVAVQSKGDILDIDADEIKIPAFSPSQLRESLQQTDNEIASLNKTLDQYAAMYIPSLNKAREALLDEVEYQQVLLKTVKQADDKLCVLTGFVPVTKDQLLENYLNESGIVFYKEKPVPNDNPPILLKNGWFARLFEPISEIFSLPNYKEMDLTPFFAPFFMMFFGFCMGDLGYGIILVLAGLLLRNRVSPSLKPYLTLAIFLGIGTMIFGIVTGTLTGFNMDEIEFFKPIHKYMLDDTSVFYLALMIGLVQIIYGMIIQAYSKWKQFGFKYALSLIGVIIAVFGVIDLALVKFGGHVSLYVIYAGVALMFLFSDPDINIFARFGKGIWDLYSNITGIFGDVLSYIRLFALSASGGILGYVINSISLPLLHSIPILGPVLFIIVMIVGHGANIALSGLGAFVHPMRLTFVEFYKNAGFEGGGKKYQPYSKRQ